MKRSQFFAGRLLSADDLRDEQNYHLATHRRHLQTLHGSGIACGLQVMDDTEKGTITIEPGLAVDAHGREINLADKATVAIPQESATPSWIVVEYAERMVDPVPVATDETMEPSRVEEGCRLVVAPSFDSGVVIARGSVVRSGPRPLIDMFENGRTSADLIAADTAEPASIDYKLFDVYTVLALASAAGRRWASGKARSRGTRYRSMPDKVRSVDRLLPLKPKILHTLLALADGPRHGYGIMQEVAERTDGQVRLWPAALYGLLRELEKTDFIVKSDHRPAADEDDERRRYFALTPHGKRVLDAEVRRLEAIITHARSSRALRKARA